MKKTAQKTDKKAKDFGIRPFSALKGFQTEQPPRREEKKESPPPLRPAPPEPDDASLFLRAVSDVKPIHPRTAKGGGKKEPSAPAAPAEVGETERREFLDALKGLKLDVTFRDEVPEIEEGARPLPVNRLRQLRRGAIRIDLELDLHGLSRDEALENLARFIGGAFRRGQEAVLVITGKGNNSPGEPVLQGAVVGWLREKGKGMVAEFAPAPRDMGGNGAVVVFLRRPEPNKPEEG